MKSEFRIPKSECRSGGTKSEIRTGSCTRKLLWISAFGIRISSAAPAALLTSLLLAAALIVFVGCESTDGGGNVSGSVYMGAGYYDTWYYGPGDCPPDIVVTPPDDRPRPEHP